MSSSQAGALHRASSSKKERPLGADRKLCSRYSGRVVFGMMIMAMFMFIGAAVDIGRWLNARDQTIAAVDAAVLAAGLALQQHG
jgi:hypothetical protein